MHSCTINSTMLNSNEPPTALNHGGVFLDKNNGDEK